MTSGLHRAPGARPRSRGLGQCDPGPYTSGGRNPARRTGPGPATPGPHRAWLVRYETGGQQFTDYWHYIRRRWVFDLLLSNPGAARLYRFPFAEYAAQTGCQDY
jgi:hypothetical protein